MKQPTLQTQYQLITEGKGNKFAFLREAKTKFPGYVPNSANFEQAVNILKTKNILNENYVDLKPINSWDRKEESYETAFKKFLKESSIRTWDDLSSQANLSPEDENKLMNFIELANNNQEVLDFIKQNFPSDKQKVLLKYYVENPIQLNESQKSSIKSNSKKIAKEVEETQENNYSNDDVKNLDNQIGQEVLNGIAFEARKNPDKTLDEIRAIVSKNLAKDKLYYLKNAAFGVEGIGYTEDVPGLKPSKSDQMQKVKLNEGLFSKNKKPKVDGTYTVEFIKGDGRGHAKVFQDPRVAKGYKDQVNSIAKDEIAIVYPTGKRPENLGDYSANVVSVNESKKPSIDDHLTKIEKAGEIATLEAKINAVDEAMKKRQERIDMIGENEDLADLVNPAKLKEMQREIKLLEKQKNKLEKIYQKITGKKKQEVVDETEVEPEELNESAKNDDALFNEFVKLKWGKANQSQWGGDFNAYKKAFEEIKDVNQAWAKYKDEFKELNEELESDVPLKKYEFEIYTKNPDTGEEGWDIEFVLIIAENYKEAVERLKTYDLFDTIITKNYLGKISKGDMDSEEYKAYENMVISDKEF